MNTIVIALSGFAREVLRVRGKVNRSWRGDEVEGARKVEDKASTNACRHIYLIF